MEDRTLSDKRRWQLEDRNYTTVSPELAKRIRTTKAVPEVDVVDSYTGQASAQNATHVYPFVQSWVHRKWVDAVKSKDPEATSDSSYFFSLLKEVVAEYRKDPMFFDFKWYIQ